MWAYESVFYQIYPLGFCGAPHENDGELSPRILKVLDWVEHIKGLNANAVYFSPLFQSDSHGYDTRDFKTIDCRLGSNEDFKTVSEALHKNGIKVVLDGVFNHVGRGFYQFLDVIKNREQSPYKDWFMINFSGNSGYNDGLWYEGWEGHYELVKLNLRNDNLINYLFECIKGWVDEFKIDGLRLDVAYCLDLDFVGRLRSFCDSLGVEFFLVGEMLHGDYKRLLGPNRLHSVTNYECYKGLFSSLNSQNLFEIIHSLLRQFGPENWTLYKGEHLMCFVDNHDVTRIASNLSNPKHLPLIYALLFAMPGIPCVYYGSEFGATGEKGKGSDWVLRESFPEPIEGELYSWIAKLALAHQNSKALCHGDFKSIVLQNKHAIFERSFEGERVLVAINISDEEVVAHFNANAGRARDLITGEEHDFGGGSTLPPRSAFYWEVF